jgi:S-adenosyl-L-methionine hydrolase (adenosine-forming)
MCFMAAQALITLTTDFGLEDIYAGVMKGVILSISPECAIVDITQSVAPQDIESGALALEAACPYFPAGAIHVAVVDPGVGGRRRSIVVVTDRCLFVGPDNGIFTFAISGPGFKAAFELTEKKYFLAELSATFHGRDVFAPVAAHLARGVPPEKMGRLITDPVLLPRAMPVLRGDLLEGRIMHSDRFGNLITNIRGDMLDGFVRDKRIHAECRNTTIEEILPLYAAAQEGELFCIVGSSNRLEISLKNGNAAARLGAGRGDMIFLKKIS